MKKVISVLLLVCMIGGMMFAAENREWRAIWSITWDQYSGSLGVDALKARTRAILDKHVEAGMNAVLWHVRQGGTVYYPSVIEPWGSYLGYSDPGYDPLEYAIDEAHKRGLELHGWFNTFHCSSTITGAPAQVNPDWVCRDGNGNPMPASRSLSPGMKAVRDYTVSLVGEIVNNYDIDGIHFDYVRWNEYDNTDFSVAAAEYAEENNLPDGVFAPGFEEYLAKRDQLDQPNYVSAVSAADNRYRYDVDHPESGGIPDSTDIFPDATPGVKFGSWAEWRRAAVSAFVEAASDTVKSIKPWVKVTPAALGRHRDAGWNGYHSTYQDAALWLNEGWIDMILAMSYHWNNGDDLRSDLSRDWRPYINKGISEGRYFSPGPGSYLLSNWAQHEDIITKVRTLDWVKGFQFFAYGDWKDSSYPQESSHTVFANMTKHPSYGWDNPTVPLKPSLVRYDSSATRTDLLITPNPSVTENQWFVIYRSNDANIDVDSDEIIKIVYTDSAFTFSDNYDGLQLNDGKYYYGATMCSRWWVESDVWQVVSSMQLPTIAPQITEAIPADGSVNIPNNQEVKLTFNKSMNADSIVANLVITPEVTNKRITWDHPKWVKEDHMVLRLTASWQFNTAYTITVGGEDQIGLAVDGNADGTGGDDYTFGFTVSGADEEAPIIVASAPEEAEAFVDIDAPITLVYNELLNKSTLKGRLSLNYAGNTIYPAYTVFESEDERTFVNIKPNSLMSSAGDIILDIAAGVADTTGNETTDEALSFETDSSYYAGQTMVDNFGGSYAWNRPGYSGSTRGINDTESSTNFTSENYVPGFGVDNDALKIIVTPDTTDWFARIYSADHNGTAGVDTAGVIQAYVFGLGDPYDIRFALREHGGSNLFEVSPWYTVDWEGWKLVEWNHHDATQFGEWGGMTGGSMDGTKYNFDSIHLQGAGTNPEAPVICYVDQLRSAVKVEGTPEPNQKPTIEAMPDTSAASGSAIYLFASYSDPNPNDILTFTATADTDLVYVRTYTSPKGKMRIRPDASFEGLSTITLTVRDNGVGEMSDTVTFVLEVSETSIADVPENFKLYANYPNPFNPVTTLHFDLPKAENVRIEIFNTAGRRVAMLADRYMEAGSWDINFDASFLSSGVYLYKVTAGADVAINKMTLLK